MSFTNILRRAASRFPPLATRATGTRSYHHLSAAAPPSHGGAVTQNVLRRLLPSGFNRFSTSAKADDTLLKVIDAEIQCARESDDFDKVEDVPENFPFKIEDEPGQQTVTLTREYQGESITVVVHMPDLVTGEEDENDNDGDTESGNQSQLPLVVRVSKKDGPCLEFGVTAYPDEISIDNLSIKDPNAGEDQIAYEGPDFGDLDENLQKAFHKYLEIRGINPRATNFLHEYMIDKDGREYVEWLNNVKKFVEA